MSQNIETMSLYVGEMKDESGSCQIPIYQTACYQFKDTGHAADLFSLDQLGYVYSRLTNPTVDALQKRIAALEGGTGATACSSGISAILLALFNLLQSGDEFVTSSRIYGGTVNMLKNSVKQFGWKAVFVDPMNLDEVKAAITDKTRAIYAESFANPEGHCCDIEALATIAHDAGIPLIIDNTMATPYLIRPIEWGADVVISSTTKFMCGNGSSMGGVVVEGGKFDWSQNDKFPLMAGPEPSYNNINLHEKFGDQAFTVRCHAVGLRDLGNCQSPMNAYMTLNGLETLALRMERHSENALSVANWLTEHPDVSWVSYCGLPSSKNFATASKYSHKGYGAVFTFGAKGGYEAAKTIVESVEMIRHVANIGDTRTLIIHPASTTHSQLTPEMQEQVGSGPSVLRISIGIEHVDDIIADLNQAIAKAS